MPSAKMLNVMIVGRASREAMEKVGAIVGTVTDWIQTAIVPEDKLQALRYVPGVECVELAAELEHCLKYTEIEIGSDKDWFANSDGAIPFDPPWDGAATGSGVIIGIVDTGLDVTLPDFLVTVSNSRVLYIWDQMQGPSGGFTAPSPYNYGVEYPKSAIDAGTVPASYKDSDGHGTHIAGIACANGRSTSGIFDDYRYVGVAPQADIIVVRGSILKFNTSFIENRVVDAVDYVFRKAAALGKPAVVLLALGHRRGGHDGTNYLDTGISALCAPISFTGRAVVAAVGNEGQNTGAHAYLDLTPGGSDVINVAVPSYTPNGQLNEYFEIEGWHNLNAAFVIRLTSPNGFTTGYIQPGFSSGVIDTTDGALRVDNDVTSAPPGNPSVKRIWVFVNEVTQGQGPRAGAWRIDVQRHAAATTGRVDFWNIGQALGGNPPMVTFTNHNNNEMCVFSPATGNSVIAVGNYVNRWEWVNVNGVPGNYNGFGVTGSLATDSNRGPRRDLVQRPDLCAPGNVVQASLTSPAGAPPSIGYISDDAMHYVRRGTSCAAAHVAGAVALFFQGNPTANCEDAREWLRDNAKNYGADTFTGAVPNTSWGYGKLKSYPLPGAGAPNAVLIPSLVDAALQRFRFSAPAGLSIDTSTTNIETTIACWNDATRSMVDCTLFTDTAAYFEVYTQEHGPLTDLHYEINGVLTTPSGVPFAPISVRFNINSSDQVETDIPLL